VDATDFAIYRYLSRDGLARFWASRRLIDPRVTAREVGEKVGLSEAGVRSRLRALRRQGLLRGSAVNLNPSLFGAQLYAIEVPIRTPRDSERLFRDLSDLEGVIFARDLIDEEDRKVAVYLAAESASALARRTNLLRRFAPGGSIRDPRPYWIPPCERALTPLDWKMLRLFRDRPDATLAELATAAGVSLKTTSRRFGSAVDSKACWWSHSSDSEEWPLALLSLSLAEGSDSPAVAREVARRCGSWIPVAEDGLGVSPRERAGGLAGLVPVGTPAALEGALRQVLALDSVAEVRRTFGLRSATYPQWADENLARRIRAGA
jgi:DNA-binding Lrp family transcriptional regulator